MKNSLSSKQLETKRIGDKEGKIGASNPNFNKEYLDDHLSEDYQTGFSHCKELVLEILDKYRNSVGASFAIEEINKL